MKFQYKLSNLLGCVYRKGNVLFSRDGSSVISPVGNRVSIFDLKNNKSETLPLQSKKNITAIDISPDSRLLIAVNEEGEALLVSLQSRAVLHTYHFHSTVHAIRFSLDGSKFAVTKDNTVQVFFTPGCLGEFNPFRLYRTFYGCYDETVCIDWTSDSKAFCVGSKDMNTRIYGAEKFSNLVIYSLGGHTDSIIAAFFEHDSLDVYTLSENGQLNVWECDTELSGLIPRSAKPQPAADKDNDDDDKDDDGSGDENEKEKGEHSEVDKVLYKRLAKHNFKKVRGEGAGPASLTAAAYHKQTHILITAFSDGAFFLHEMPDFILIHSLSVSEQAVSSVTFSPSGDWVALACSGLGQLMVWEWQSQSYVLKQQGHYSMMNCLAYSPDAQYVATGSDDAKVKVWSTSTGFCFVTFNEHLGGVTGVMFSQSGQVVVSSSLDGTVRAFDLNRYRNFRTFTSPRPAQFGCLTLDPSGEIVCAGAVDTFEIFVWSMKTGRLLDILAGHGGPVSGLSFTTAHSILASTSWDHTLRLWDLFTSKSSKELIQLSSDGLAVAYRPDGQELAVSTLDGHISLWSVHNTTQIATIEGRHDLGYTRREGDKITAKKSAANKVFTSLCYTADGKCLLAAGRSKFICIYSTAEQMLLKKFEITCNLSLDDMQEFLDRRKMTEFGSLALVDDEEGTEIKLPGARKGDMSARHFKPEVRVSCVQFSPTGRAFGAATTEGLLIYSLDHSLVFDPFDLEIEVTPNTIRQCLKAEDFTKALMMSFRLNEQALIQEVVECIPVSHVELISQTLSDIYVDKMLHFIATMLEKSKHLEFYLLWCHKLLVFHGSKLKQRSKDVMALLRSLQKVLSQRHKDISKLCDHNKYTTRYLLSLAETKRKRPHVTSDPSEQVSEVEVGSDVESEAGSVLNMSDFDSSCYYHG